MNRIPHKFLKDHKIILASKSPRRKQLLEQINIDIAVVPSNFAENLDKSKCEPHEYVIATASGKAQDISQNQEDGTIVIGADTVVVLDNHILEKPLSPAHAKDMLTNLRGRSHNVLTGVCICYRGQTHTFYESSTVTFSDYSDDLIDWYIRTEEPFDKAGGYGIQGMGAVLVDRVEGCYNNVVGLPLHALFNQLQKIL